MLRFAANPGLYGLSPCLIRNAGHKWVKRTPERGHIWIINNSVLFIIRCTTTTSTVLIVTSAFEFGLIPVFDM